MALIDLKSKLNRFSSEKDNPNKPYQRFGNDITDLENSPRPDIDREKFLENGQKLESNLTNVDSELDRQNTPKSNINRKSSFGRSLKEFVEDFALSSYDVPNSNNYEDDIKLEATGVTRGIKPVENLIKNAKDIFKGNVSKGIRGIIESNQDEKLSEYRARAYGKIKNTGEPGRKVSSVDRKVSDTFQGPIKGGAKSKNVDKVNIAPYGDKAGGKDLIPFRFRDVYNDKYITFRAILSGISDSISPEYNAERYIGRPESVYIYQGTNRTISFTFDVYPQTRQELPVLWEKINYLVGLCYPNWTDSPYSTSNQSLTMVSPITNLTIGDVYNETPGYLGNVSVNIQDNTTWEIEQNLELPQYVQISCEFIYIGKYLPNAKGKHFELNWIKDTNNKSGTLSYVFGNKDGEQGVIRDRDYRWIDDTRSGVTINGKKPRTYFTEVFKATRTDEKKR